MMVRQAHHERIWMLWSGRVVCAEEVDEAGEVAAGVVDGGGVQNIQQAYVIAAFSVTLFGTIAGGVAQGVINIAR